MGEKQTPLLVRGCCVVGEQRVAMYLLVIKMFDKYQIILVTTTTKMKKFTLPFCISIVSMILVIFILVTSLFCYKFLFFFHRKDRQNAKQWLSEA